MKDFISKFSKIVEKYPRDIAISVDGKYELTYVELYQSALRVAACLRANNIKKGEVVAIYLPKSSEYVVSLLGIWLSGAAFMPLDPSLPNERKIFMLKDAEPKGIIVLNKEKFDYSKYTKNIIEIQSALKFAIINEIPQKNEPDDLAYLIYTSGSTGIPKGVMVNHAGIVNLLEEQIRTFALEPKKRFLFFVSINFDASISDIGTTLLSGATLCIETGSSLEVASQITNIFLQRKITHTDIPPSLLEVINVNEISNTLETIVIGGETTSIKTVKNGQKNFVL